MGKLFFSNRGALNTKKKANIELCVCVHFSDCIYIQEPFYPRTNTMERETKSCTYWMCMDSIFHIKMYACIPKVV